MASCKFHKTVPLPLPLPLFYLLDPSHYICIVIHGTHIWYILLNILEYKKTHVV